MKKMKQQQKSKNTKWNHYKIWSERRWWPNDRKVSKMDKFTKGTMKVDLAMWISVRMGIEKALVAKWQENAQNGKNDDCATSRLVKCVDMNQLCDEPPFIFCFILHNKMIHSVDMNNRPPAEPPNVCICLHSKMVHCIDIVHRIIGLYRHTGQICWVKISKN